MLTLQFLPWSEIGGLTQEERLKKLLAIVREEKIVLLEGRLKSNEKSSLIAMTMGEISQKFKGIEIEEISSESKGTALLEKIRSIFINLLLGDRRGFTIIGPASIIKEIKRDPDKIQLLTQDAKSRKKR